MPRHEIITRADPDDVDGAILAEEPGGVYSLTFDGITGHETTIYFRDVDRRRNGFELRVGRQTVGQIGGAPGAISEVLWKIAEGVEVTP